MFKIIKKEINDIYEDTVTLLVFSKHSMHILFQLTDLTLGGQTWLKERKQSKDHVDYSWHVDNSLGEYELQKLFTVDKTIFFQATVPSLEWPQWSAAYTKYFLISRC